MLASGIRVRRVVAEIRVLHHMGATSMRKPSTPRSSQKRATSNIAERTCGVSPVQVRLLGQEDVEVVLLPRFIPLPGRAGEHADPVVRQSAVRLRVAPHVPVRLRVVPRRARLDEPGVLVAGVVRDVVDEDPDAARVRLGDQLVEVSEGAEERVDIGVVGDVVAEVGHGGGVEGRDPDGIHAQPGEVVEPPGDARQIAGPVTVRVEEAPRVDLVHDGRLPPAWVRCLHAGRLAGSRHRARACYDRRRWLSR